MSAQTMIFAAVLSLVAGFILAYVTGRVTLRVLSGKRVGQQVREEGPASHYKKTGTPTFGGVIFLVPYTLISLIDLIWHFHLHKLYFLLFVLVMAAVGFLDDFIKVRVDRDGLSIRNKTISLLGPIVLFVLAITLGQKDIPMYLPHADARPFFLPTHLWLAALLFVLFGIFYLYACVNAVNITDGVDGLCSSVTVIAVLATWIVNIAFSKAVLALNPELNLTMPCMGLIGGLLGFLIYNQHPARIFMGDFGSLALGAFVSGALLLTGHPVLFLLIGLIYWLEIGSVTLQVAYFKKTGGKRIFRMSPIHHHFELGGWTEQQIVTRFCLLAAVGAVIALWIAAWT